MSKPPPQVKHVSEHIRDVPASCICRWHWDGLVRRYVKSNSYAQVWITAFCPWHGVGEVRQP